MVENEYIILWETCSCTKIIHVYYNFLNFTKIKPSVDTYKCTSTSL